MINLNFCECKQDGFCPRYNREMGGRFRQICQGINVDLGTAAAFREQWSREAGDIRMLHTNSPTPLLLITDQAPGDTVAMTAAIYSLHKAYPGKYLTAVQSPHPEVFKYNPNVVPLTMYPGSVAEVRMHYPAIHKSNERGIHFMQGWCEFLGTALGIQVPLLTNRPQLYFDMYDYDDPPTEDFWLICSGGKTDFTNKLWGWENYQEVVDILCNQVKFIQVGEKHEDHPLLYLYSGSKDMVGKTTLRQLFGLVRRCRGVLCGVSLLMHVAAALDKPAIVIAGGREPVQWNAYPKQHYLHTVGNLPCCESGGCWRSRVVPLEDGSIELNKNTCERVIWKNKTPIPGCMSIIKPQLVADLVLRYTK